MTGKEGRGYLKRAPEGKGTRLLLIGGEGGFFIQRKALKMEESLRQGGNKERRGGNKTF